METETGLNLFFWTGTLVMLFSVLGSVLVIVTYWNKRTINSQGHEALLSIDSEHKRHINFTETELKVIRLSAQGLKAREIADTMCVSPSTVNAHKQNIQKKYNFDSMMSAVLYCLQNKIIVLEDSKDKNS